MAHETGLPECRDLWPEILPDKIVEFEAKKLAGSNSETLDDELTNEYIRIVKNLMDSDPTEQWKKDFIKDFKAKCLSFIDNKEMKEAHNCYNEVAEGKCHLKHIEYVLVIQN